MPIQSAAFNCKTFVKLKNNLVISALYQLYSQPYVISELDPYNTYKITGLLGLIKAPLEGRKILNLPLSQEDAGRRAA